MWRKPWAKRWQRHRQSHGAARGLRDQSEEEEAHRRMFWLAEEYCADAQSAASRDAEGRLDLYVRVRGLQSGAHAEPDAQRSFDVGRPGRSVSERSCNASLGRSVARKITPQMLENSRMTQTDQEIAGSERFFRSLLEFVAGP